MRIEYLFARALSGKVADKQYEEPYRTPTLQAYKSARNGGPCTSLIDRVPVKSYSYSKPWPADLMASLAPLAFRLLNKSPLHPCEAGLLRLLWKNWGDLAGRIMAGPLPLATKANGHPNCSLGDEKNPYCFYPFNFVDGVKFH
jgi:hypothetical protein